MNDSTTDTPGPNETAGPKPRWRRLLSAPGWQRWLVRGVVVLAGVTVLLVVALNVFLKTRLFRNAIGADPMAMLVDYDSAWSLLPGHIHATNVMIRGKDGAVEWRLTVKEVDFTVALTELLHRRFHATKVRGTGVVFRARQRIDPADATPALLAALPAIDGLEEVPLKDPVKKPPPSDAEYHLWSARLDDVVVDPLDELWIDAMRFTGEARVTGSFELRPLRWLEVGASSVDVRSGAVHTGAPIVLEKMLGKIEGAIHGFDLRDSPPVTDLVRHVSTHARIDGVIPSLAFVDRVTAPSGVRASGGGGAAHLEVSLEDGKLATGTAILIDSTDARVSAEGHSAVGTARSKLSVVAGEARLEIAIAPLAVEREDEKAPLLRVRAVEVAARSRGLDVARFFEEPSYAIDVTEGQLPDLRLFTKYLGKGGALQIDGGHGRVHGHVELGGAAAKGTASIALEDAALRLADTRLRGNATVGVNLARGSLRDLDLSGTRIDLANVTTAASAGAPPWSGRVDLPAAHLRVEGGLDFTASLVAACRDARPVVALIAADSPLPGWAAGLVSEDGLKATAQLHVSAARTFLRGLRAKVGPFSIAADFLKQGARPRSLLLVQRAPFAVGIDAREGSTSIVLLDATGWFERAEAELPKL